MEYIKVIPCIVVWAALLNTVFCFLGVLASQTEKPQVYECRDTKIEVGGNDTAVEAALRQFVLDYWNRPEYSNLPEKSQQLINEIINRNETDSLRELNVFKTFSMFHSVYATLAENDIYGICTIAQTINGSVAWADSKDGRITLDVIRNLQSSQLQWCTALAVESLKSNGCKKLPALSLPGNSDCFKKGFVYELERALHYFGKDLPCVITELLYAMYHSENYQDNLLAAVFVEALTEAIDDIIQVYSIDLLLEIVYAVVEPNDKICCCKQRRERFLDVCSSLNSSDFSRVISKYENTECPPGADYLK